MDNPTRYCENCGKPLDANARFCGRCGKPVPTADRVVAPPSGQIPRPAPPQPKVQAPQAAQARAEAVLGVISNGIRKKGLFNLGGDTFHMVVTNQRLIFARQTNEMVIAERQQFKEAAKSQDKGFFGQWGAIAFTQGGKRYYDMPVEAILREHPDNFFFFPQQIRSVKTRYNSDEGSSQTEYQLLLETISGKLVLSYAALNEKETKNILRQLLGGVVR